jgi:hypothetical protein
MDRGLATSPKGDGTIGRESRGSEMCLRMVHTGDVESTARGFQD